MRDKYDFENLVYEKAGTLAAKERKYAGYRKAALSSAAVFAVLIVGSVFVFNNGFVSFHSMPATNAANGAAKADNENDYYADKNAAVYDEYESTTAEDYDSIDMYDNDLQENDGDSFTDYSEEGEFSSMSLNSANSSAKSANESFDDLRQGTVTDVRHNGKVIYKGENIRITTVNEDIFENFKETVQDLQETKTLIDEGRESSAEIQIIELGENGIEYRTSISVYGDILKITYEEYFYNTSSNPQETYNTANNPVKIYCISDEFIRLVRENFDENFMKD